MVKSGTPGAVVERTVARWTSSRECAVTNKEKKVAAKVAGGSRGSIAERLEADAIQEATWLVDGPHCDTDTVHYSFPTIDRRLFSLRFFTGRAHWNGAIAWDGSVLGTAHPTGGARLRARGRPLTSVMS
jgi:hypothetical protein